MLSEIPEALDGAVGAGSDLLHGCTQLMRNAPIQGAGVWNEINEIK